MPMDLRRSAILQKIEQVLTSGACFRIKLVSSDFVEEQECSWTPFDAPDLLTQIDRKSVV